MNIRINLISPTLLIVIGVGYLLANLGIVSMTPWQAFVKYWPTILIWYGVTNILKGVRQKLKNYSVSSGEMILWAFLAGAGFYILAPRIGLEIIPISWSLVWPILLIVLGITQLFSKEGIFHFHSDLSEESTPNKTAQTSFVGEVSRGGHSWVLDDLYLRHGVGEVHLDLTQAIIPDKETRIDVSGLVGEVIIYLPPDLPVKVHCSAGIGEINVLDLHEEGVNKFISFQSPDYPASVRKVNIRVAWRIGEIKIRRIG